MANQQIFLKQILCEIVELFVFGAESIGGRDAGDAGHFVHVLLIDWVVNFCGFGWVRKSRRKLTTSVHDPAK